MCASPSRKLSNPWSKQAPSDALEARALKDIDLDALELESFNGADLEPPYELPVPSTEPKEAEGGLKVYYGNCHCRAVTYSVKTKPLTETKVISCNCSLCSRVRFLLLLPHAPQPIN
jgi:hypothetical protein